VLAGAKINTNSVAIITDINISNTETWTSLLYKDVTLFCTATENDVWLEECSQIIFHCHKLKKKKIWQICFRIFKRKRKLNIQKYGVSLHISGQTYIYIYINVIVVPYSYSAVLNQVTYQLLIIIFSTQPAVLNNVTQKSNWLFSVDILPY